MYILYLGIYLRFYMCRSMHVLSANCTLVPGRQNARKEKKEREYE